MSAVFTYTLKTREIDERINVGGGRDRVADDVSYTPTTGISSSGDDVRIDRTT